MTLCSHIALIILTCGGTCLSPLPKYTTRMCLILSPTVSKLCKRTEGSEVRDSSCCRPGLENLGKIPATWHSMTALISVSVLVKACLCLLGACLIRMVIKGPRIFFKILRQIPGYFARQSELFIQHWLDFPATFCLMLSTSKISDM